jgi:hypothetical protein
MKIRREVAEWRATSARTGWSLLFIWSFSFVWLNQTDQMNQNFELQVAPGAPRPVNVRSPFANEAPRSKLRGILRNSPTRRPEPLGGVPKLLSSFAKATEGSPRLHPRSCLLR